MLDINLKLKNNSHYAYVAKNKTLFSKIFKISASLILASTTILGVVILFLASNYFRVDKFDLLSRTVAAAVQQTKVQNLNPLTGSVNIDIAQTKEGYIAFSNAVNAQISLVDLNGNTIICSDETICTHVDKTINSSIISKVLEKGSYEEIGYLGSLFEEPYYTVAMPIYTMINPAPVGIIVASASASGLKNLLSEILKTYMACAIMITVISFGLIYILTNKLVNPIRTMVVATETFSKGDFSVRVPKSSNDEIGKLALAFNNMASSLSVLETTRRSFIANVSHELRTPMTTISGFIDGVLDGTIPEEKHDYYLRIISGEIKRLARLVHSMLNLARIEAGELSINPQAFDITKLVCDSIFTFEQKIDDKKVTVEGLEVGKIMVCADTDMIHQVLYNLIENAVKFVNENGTISFKYRVDGAKTYISVKNTGAGIAKEDLPKVFERFYKADKSRSADIKSVGLGLHIVRSIVDLHSCDIVVKSIQNQYCEFEFWLPSAKISQSIFKKNDKNKQLINQIETT